MEDAVHARRGLWIAPAAPGFDARLVGGTIGRRAEERRDAAARSTTRRSSASPDAIGLISWNEFSENSHIEPSVRYGSRYLEVLADIRGAKAPRVEVFDSSEPATSAKGYGPVVLGAFVVIVLSGAVFSCCVASRVGPDRPKKPLEDRG